MGLYPEYGTPAVRLVEEAGPISQSLLVWLRASQRKGNKPETSSPDLAPETLQALPSNWANDKLPNCHASPPIASAWPDFPAMPLKIQARVS